MCSLYWNIPHHFRGNQHICHSKNILEVEIVRHFKHGDIQDNRLLQVQHMILCILDDIFHDSHHFEMFLQSTWLARQRRRLSVMMTAPKSICFKERSSSDSKLVLTMYSDVKYESSNCIWLRILTCMYISFKWNLKKKVNWTLRNQHWRFTLQLDVTLLV